ncbi:MAG: glycoside hydrolase family 3 N-terminal domain-containing protein [Butyricicoccus sp.]
MLILRPCATFRPTRRFHLRAQLRRDAEQTGEYVRTVVTQMVSDKTGMVLKHFPGYGNNADTHTGIAIDERPMDTFRQSDFLPFEAGIESGAQSVLVSHNVVNCMDADRPASLSAEVHRILREELGFDGVILTDDLIMDAIRDYTGGENAAVLAVQAGNDMLTSSDFVTQYNAVLAAYRTARFPSRRFTLPPCASSTGKCSLD